jgi:hypothetical protein
LYYVIVARHHACCNTLTIGLDSAPDRSASVIDRDGDDSGSGGLSGGAIAGIVSAVVVVAGAGAEAVVIVIVVVFLPKRKSSDELSDPPSEGNHLTHWH